jgi:hypothetical protein
MKVLKHVQHFFSLFYLHFKIHNWLKFVQISKTVTILLSKCGIMKSSICILIQHSLEMLDPDPDPYRLPPELLQDVEKLFNRFLIFCLFQN